MSKRLFDGELPRADQELLAELRATLVQPCSDADAISYALRAAVWLHRQLADAPDELAALQPPRRRRR